MTKKKIKLSSLCFSTKQICFLEKDQGQESLMMKYQVGNWLQKEIDNNFLAEGSGQTDGIFEDRFERPGISDQFKIIR